MKRFFLFASFFVATIAIAQPPATFVKPEFYNIKSIKATPVKNQAMTGTCWCFATTSLLESEDIRSQNNPVDLSEMFTVRNMYIEKARNYILRMGHAQFGEGGLGHDLIRAVAIYGAVPLNVYSGLVNGATTYNHSKMFNSLQGYLDSVLKVVPVASNWLNGYTKILDQYMGVPPTEFTYEGRKYTPLTFAKDVLKFNADDYVSLTSFTHVPEYQSFILQVPDNFSNGSFYNLPLNEFISTVESAVNNGYSVSWDADVSNKGFMQNAGMALNLEPNINYTRDMINTGIKEAPADPVVRQQLYENLTTQDDHLMHIVGIEKSKEGKTFFVVKNSWGKVGPFEGYINVSEPYFAINTISVVLPKAALSNEVRAKLKLQ
ncbi:MAG: C1 family peptidase [Candidatus Dadabacteria bacterium]